MGRSLNRVSFYAAHSFLGLTVGAVSAELWLHALRHDVPLWVIGLVALVFVLGVEMAVGSLLRRRAVRRSRRRAHARPHSKTRKAA